MKRLRKIISVITLLCILSADAGAIAAESEDANSFAMMYFDGIGTNINIQSSYSPGNLTYANQKGTQGIMLDGSTSFYSYINLNDNVFSTNSITPSAITIRYFDTGKGYISLRYATQTASWIEPEKLEMTNTGEWKEYTFYLDDIAYRGALNTADICLAAWTNLYGATQEPVYVQWMKIEKVYPQKPISTTVTSNHIGNIFDGDDEKLISIRFDNIGDVPLDVSAGYEVRTYGGNVLGSGRTESVKCEGNSSAEAATIDVSEYAKEFGCYYLLVKTHAEGIVDGEHRSFDGDFGEHGFSVVNKTGEGEALNPLTKMNGHWTYLNSYYQPDTDSALMRQIGVSGIRDGIYWGNVETSPGSYSPGARAEFIKDFKANGLDIMNQLAFSNSLYFSGSGHQMPQTEAQKQAWVKFVEFMTKEYADEIKHWELWNEPNLMNFNAAGLSGDKYAELAKITYPIIKKNIPDSVVGVFSTAQIPMDFIGAAVEAGILDYTDTATVHPYDWNLPASGVDYHFRNDFYIERMQDFKKYLAENGHPDMPVIITELGVTTTESSQSWGSKTMQAAILLQQLLMTEGHELADAIYFYEWATDSPDPNDAEGNWGFVECAVGSVPFAAKPSYVMLGNYNKLLTDVKTEGIIERGDTTAYRFRRNSDGEQVIALWNEMGSDSFALNLGTDNIKIMDMYGNIISDLSESSGIYNIHTTFEPFYILGDFTSFEQAQPEITVENGRLYAAPEDYVKFKITDSKKRNLTIRAKCPAVIEVSEIENIINGEGTVTVHTLGDAVKDNGVIIEAYDGDRMIYSTKVHVCIREPMSVKAGVIRVSPDNSTRFLASVNITNETNSAKLSGKVSADFTEVGGGLEIRNFEKLKPSETVNVTLNLPEQIVKRTVTATGYIELDYGYTIPVDFNFSAINASYADTNVNLTGAIDYSWWNGGDWFAADDDYAAKYYKNWGGVDDCSFKAITKWDEDNFYLMLEASDDVYHQTETGRYIWRGDGIQFCIAPTLENGDISSEFTEFGISKTPAGIVIFRYNSQTMYNEGSTGLTSNTIIENAQATVEQLDGKYIYRAAIPWSEIFGAYASVKENDTYGFSLILNDNDGADRYWMEYTSGIGNQKNSYLFGKMTLKK